MRIRIKYNNNILFGTKLRNIDPSGNLILIELDINPKEDNLSCKRDYIVVSKEVIF